MIYGCETWPMLTEHEQWLERAEMRMLRWMSGVKLSDRRSSNELRKAMGVERIGDVTRRGRLRWFGHVRRRDENEWIKKLCELEVQGRKPAGRPKKTWTNVVEKDLKALHLKESDALNRDLWRTAIKGDPSNPAVPGKRT